MKHYAIFLAACGLAFAGCKSEPIFLHTYQEGVMAYPDDFPNDQPVILAFLNANDRSCDKVIRPLRGLSARPGAKLVGIMTYDDNAFLQNLSTKNEIVFPVMLDPTRKMVDKFGVSRFPTFLLLNTKGDVIDRQYDVANVTAWYKPMWIDKALQRRHVPTPEEKGGDGS